MRARDAFGLVKVSDTRRSDKITPASLESPPNTNQTAFRVVGRCSVRKHEWLFSAWLLQAAQCELQQFAQNPGIVAHGYFRTWCIHPFRKWVFYALLENFEACPTSLCAA